jgi:flagellar hook-associated protein 1 FlgK
MSGLLSNAISGLQASQIALRTAGNNISNANTEGYSRQNVNFATRTSQQVGQAGFLGNGVTTESVTRVVNEFLTTQVRLDTSAFNQLDKYNTNISKIDSLFSDASTGLSGSLQTFFSALQNGASDPAATPARQLIISQADSLSERFNNLYGRLAETEKSVNGEISNIVGKINSLATSIANLNQSIGAKNAANSGGQANDLFDQRDEALRKLAELTSVQLVKDASGDTNVFIGNGEPLVVGPHASKLTTDSNGSIFFEGKSSSFDITDEITGGQLGGSLTFKTDALNPAFNELGRVAIVMSDAFNKTQRQGLDLNGNYGNPMFTDINDSIVSANRVHPGNNAAPNNHVLSVTIDDASKITSSDYEFMVNPGSSNYVITRSSDNTVVSQGVVPVALPTVPPTVLTFDGISVHLDGGTFQGGDRFTLQPTRSGANEIHSLLDAPASIAFAAPIRTLASTGNIGVSTISAGKVLSVYDANNNLLPAFATAGQLAPPLLVRFTSDTTYDILDATDPANPIPLVPAMREQHFIPNRENSLFSEDKGEMLVVGAGPSSGTAAQAAAALNNFPGVTAHAFTSATLSNVTVATVSTLQITINGENVLGAPYPNPLPTSQVAINDYLESQINANPNLRSLGIRAESSSDINGAPQLRLVASSGVDLDIQLTDPSASITVKDVNAPFTQLNTTGQSVSVVGTIDVTLAEGVALPPSVPLTGVLTPVSSYKGYQVSISGQPKQGDVFSIVFNNNAKNDNRNGLVMTGLETAKTMDGGTISFGQGYGQLVEQVGTKSNLSSINTSASKSLLEQTKTMRDGVSGVNLDEEAASLIEFQQLYSANARVITVARDLFDALLNSLG